MSEKWILRVVRFGRPGTVGDGLGWDGRSDIEIDGEPVAVVHEKSGVIVYLKKKVEDS